MTRINKNHINLLGLLCTHCVLRGDLKWHVQFSHLPSCSGSCAEGGPGCSKSSHDRGGRSHTCCTGNMCRRWETCGSGSRSPRDAATASPCTTAVGLRFSLLEWDQNTLGRGGNAPGGPLAGISDGWPWSSYTLRVYFAHSQTGSRPGAGQGIPGDPPCRLGRHHPGQLCGVEQCVTTGHCHVTWGSYLIG